MSRGAIAVDPGAWFFQAHFYQDPVWPGSLGLESFLQLLKFVAFHRLGPPPAGGWRAVAVGASGRVSGRVWALTVRLPVRR